MSTKTCHGLGPVRYPEMALPEDTTKFLNISPRNRSRITALHYRPRSFTNLWFLKEFDTDALVINTTRWRIETLG